MKFERLILVSLGLLAAAQAQTIYDVVNYGSRIGTGLPSSGVAQGALFAVTGYGLGPDQAMQGSFPLTTASGLAGVTVTIVASDGSTTNAIMVYVSAAEVDAILPSGTPLGSATLTLNYNGATAKAAMNVVGSAFGIFSGAGIFNVNADGSTSLNTPLQSASAGQTILISGTGLGAIPSDETQSGVTDVPSATVVIWIGTTQATVVSAGRGTCCAQINPNFAVPQGLAAWDVIAVVVPDGVVGCLVSIAVQVGNSVSNLVNFSVATGTSTCLEASAVNGGNPLLVSGVAKQGLINLLHSQTLVNVSGTVVNSISDSATAIFFPVDFGPSPVPIPSYSASLRGSVGSCFVTRGRFDSSIKVVAPPSSGGGTGPSPLDAGPFLTLTTTGVNQILKKQSGLYSASASISSVAVPGFPPTVTGGPGFLIPGSYMLDNGAGGADIAPFVATLNNPTPVNWDSMAQNLTVNRSQGATVSWSGGDANGVLVITGSSSSTSGTVIYSGSFGCYAAVSAGTFTVPSFVTSQLPPSSNPPLGSVMLLGAILSDVVNIPGVDVTYYFSQQTVGTQVAYQ